MDKPDFSIPTHFACLICGRIIRFVILTRVDDGYCVPPFVAGLFQRAAHGLGRMMVRDLIISPSGKRRTNVLWPLLKKWYEKVSFSPLDNATTVCPSSCILRLKRMSFTKLHPISSCES